MLHFDGEYRSCVKYVKKKVGLRCIEFKEGKAQPDCPSQSNKSYKLKGGGRSQNYIRSRGRCSESAATKRRAAPKTGRTFQKTIKLSRKKK